MPRSDDPAILDEDELWRRLLPTWVVEENGKVRISSAAFWQDGEIGEISVNVGRLSTKGKALETYPTHSLGALEAIFPRRQLGFTVALEDDPGNQGHAHIYPKEGMSKSARRKASGKMAEQAIIIEQRTPAIPTRRQPD